MGVRDGISNSRNKIRRIPGDNKICGACSSIASNPRCGLFVFHRSRRPSEVCSVYGIHGDGFVLPRSPLNPRLSFGRPYFPFLQIRPLSFLRFFHSPTSFPLPRLKAAHVRAVRSRFLNFSEFAHFPGHRSRRPAVQFELAAAS